MRYVRSADILVYTPEAFDRMGEVGLGWAVRQGGVTRLCIPDRAHLEHALKIRGRGLLTRGDIEPARGVHAGEPGVVLIVSPWGSI